MQSIIVLNDYDNVGNAIEDIKPGQVICYKIREKEYSLQSIDHIPFGFKIAINHIAKGENVIKYGEIIGKANGDISEGELVHIHNVEGGRGRGDLNRNETSLL